MKISVVISAFNEEDKIEDCLASAKLIADEIIFVDNTSNDKTVVIAKKYTTKIFIRPNDPVMLNRNKNFGFTKVTGDWILSLDADERLTPELIREIRSKISVNQFSGYEIPRKNIIFGKWIKHSIWWPDYNLRLFRKGKGKFPLAHVHEKLQVKEEVGRLKNPMIHYNYQTVSQFIQKLDRTYTESETENFLREGKSISWYDAIRWPTADFVKTFFFQKGYKDGLHGLVLCLFQAFYSLVFFAKVWERKEKFSELAPKENFLDAVSLEFKKSSKEIRYWIYQSLIAQSPLRALYYKVRRKL
ncbi:MAG: hypothetical protein A2909_01265 [Candidatus Tagabacteria bacterium RIFCSPLOWO2_01_FULL_39_11]|uniref:Glycosyltransferase 2-like domain-containing protein n=1 Tax=Candidatus Tagabacteria bacterium RIFCSPLOWO2_01_FULL_39_11 TaxID=1802295 RepID=A0A1G2LT56_9BACT|nr:MAG: hypothetical protein A2909_01265 [Candidatus Tagabacteria bacterium RIFCSPLOWO2_01_FULL_39_11]